MHLLLDSLGQCLCKVFPVEGHSIQLCEVGTRKGHCFLNFFFFKYCSLHFSDVFPIYFLLRTFMFTGLKTRRPDLESRAGKLDREAGNTLTRFTKTFALLGA